MWLLTYNGTQKSFASWGLSNLRRSRVSQAQDTVSFTAPGPYDAAELFPFGSSISISYQPDAGGAIVPWFLGRVIQIPRAGAPDEESMDYKLAGPWWYLDNLVFQQEWQFGSPPAPAYKSRVILGQTIAGARLTSGQVIAEVLAYAIASGAPIAVGTFEPDLNIPLDEENDITCAEAIRRMLRWSPDALTWFDYGTTPYPTFHCARRPALSALSLALTPSTLNLQPSTLSVTPRPDLQVPSVFLKFEQVNTIDGKDYERITIDTWPAGATGREFGALIATLQLAGFQATFLTQKIVATPIPLGEDAFWQAHDETYKATGKWVSAVQAHSTEATPDDGYDNELSEGQIQDWMLDPPLELHTKAVVYTAIAVVTYKDDADNIIKVEKKVLSCKIITTDAETKTYHRLGSLITGEATPVGLAKAIYDSLNPLQYEGSITLTEEECGATIASALRAALGYKLNLTGGLAAWASMNALIQQIDEDVDTGRTTISFGPPEQLSPQDLMEFLRANRGRATAISYQKRVTGEAASASATIALSGPTPLVNTAGAGGQTKLLTITDDTRKIVLNPALISAETVGQVLAIKSATEMGLAEILHDDLTIELDTDKKLSVIGRAGASVGDVFSRKPDGSFGWLPGTAPGDPDTTTIVLDGSSKLSIIDRDGAANGDVLQKKAGAFTWDPPPGDVVLPEGGTDGQLLQRDAALAAVWGWGRMKAP